MSTDVVCRVFAGGLHAVNGAECSKLERLSGKEVMCKISQPRNLRFHRKGFALFHAVYELADTDLTFEQFRKVLVAKAGYGDFIQGKNDQLIFLPKSLAWGSMDETEFERVYQDVLTTAIKEYAIDENTLNQMVQFA